MFTYHGVTIRADEILIYARKSRTDDPLLTIDEVLEKHENILNNWCENNLGGLVPEVQKFREIVSGETIAARKEIQTILRLIEQPQYKAILTVDAQRLSRGDLEDAGRIIKLLRYTNTFVITPDMVFDLADDYDRERFKRELERGNDYLEYYKKINLRGRLESFRAGWFIGSVSPYGYDKCWVMDGKKKRPTLKINEYEAELVRLIFDLYVNKGMGYTNIVHHLISLGYTPRNGGTWKTQTIRDILTNVHSIGKVKWNGRMTVNVVEGGEIRKTRPRNSNAEICDGRHPAIISIEMFEMAQAKMGKNPKVKSDRELRNPFAGLLYCQCGRAMSYRQNKAKGHERSLPRLMCDHQMYCGNKSVMYHEMLSKVIGVLRACVADFEMQIKGGSDTEINRAAQLKRLEARLDDLNQKELNQWEKYAEDGMPKVVFDKLNEKVLAEKAVVLHAIEDAKKDAPTVEYYQDKIMLFSDAINALDSPKATAEQKNGLLKACIERIDYKREGKGDRFNNAPFELDIKLKV